jgi:hypothetical protein
MSTSSKERAPDKATYRGRTRNGYRATIALTYPPSETEATAFIAGVNRL